MDITSNLICIYCSKPKTNNIICDECRDIINEVIQRRNIRYLVHFTSLNNLASIIRHGVLSVQKMQELSILDYDFNDYYRLDNMTNCICCSIQFPNRVLLSRFELTFNKIFIILVIDVKILLDRVAYCSRMNAALASGRFIQPIINLELLFEGNRKADMPEYFPTSVQAEVLIKDNIDPEYIIGVIVKDEKTKRIIENEIDNSIEILVNPYFFYNRE